MQKILIIDDDPTGTRLLMTLLKFEGYEPHPVENWQDPVSDIERVRPDLVIMDVYLRIGDGFQLLRQLRTHPDSEVCRIPVLMVSAEDQRARCRDAGAQGFLEKPFNVRMLIETIREIEKEVSEGKDPCN